MSKRLYRSSRERLLGGVAGGIAEYFDVDPTLVRLAWVILFLAGGFGILAYIIAWIIIPEEPSARSRSSREGTGPGSGPSPDPNAGGQAVLEGRPAETVESDAGRDERGRMTGAWVFGLLLVAVGLFLLVRNFVPLLWFVSWWPVVLVAAGVLLLVGAFRHDHGGRDGGHGERDRQ